MAMPDDKRAPALRGAERAEHPAHDRRLPRRDPPHGSRGACARRRVLEVLNATGTLLAGQLELSGAPREQFQHFVQPRATALFGPTFPGDPPIRIDDVPAIALTAFARAEDRTRALRAGFVVHVSQPVDASELVATVASVAGRADE